MWRFHVKLTRPLRLEVEWAVDPERHPVIALTGPNGAGKSTCLRALAGLLGEAQGGLSGPPWARPITWVPQEPSLIPHRTVRRQIEWVLGSRLDEAVDLAPWLETLDAASWLGRSARDLSGGERQRATLLRALAARPRILALDESLGEIDAPTRDAILDRLRAWANAEADRLLILTGHDFGEVARIADRVLVFKAGRILRDDDPDEMRRNPGTWEIAALVGFVARIRVGDRVLALPPDGVALEPPGRAFAATAIRRGRSRWAARLPVIEGREEFPLPAAPSPEIEGALVVYLRGVPLDAEGGRRDGL